MISTTLVLALAAAGAAGASLEETLMKLENGAMERWRQGDPMGWAEISAPEVTYVDPGLTKPVAGREAYTKYLEALKGKIHYDGSEYLRPRVVQYGDLAVMTYNYRSTSKDARTLWNTTEVYARIGGERGQWKIVHTHWSFVNHESPDSVEMPVPMHTEPVAYSGVLGEVMALEMAAMERWRKGDPWGFTEISAPAVTYFDSGTPQRIDGVAALKEEYAKRAGKIHYDVMDFVEPMVQVHGDAAVLFYRFVDTHLNPDGSVSRRTPWNCTEVYVRSAGGSWRIVHTHWSLVNGRSR